MAEGAADKAQRPPHVGRALCYMEFVLFAEDTVDTQSDFVYTLGKCTLGAMNRIMELGKEA